VTIALTVLAAALLIAASVWFVSAPLRGSGADAPEPDKERAGLQAAKDAKLREIRDAELDYRTGKLSDADYRSLDSQLRSEAATLLHELDRHGG
jgi:hypothetical protein